MKKGTVLITLLLVIAATALAEESTFYASMLDRGITDAMNGNHVRAIGELRIAAFGFVDSIPQYELAQIYLAIAAERAGVATDAQTAVAKFQLAETIRPTYARLTIPQTAREAFDKILAKYPHARPPEFTGRPSTAAPAPTGTTQLPKERSTKNPPALDPVPSPGPSVVQPVPVTTQRATSPAPENPASTKNSEKLKEVLTQQTPFEKSQKDTVASNLEVAERDLEANDEAGARKAAETVLKVDPTNARAHEILGLLDFRHKQWLGVISHFSAVRTRQKLTGDENAMLFVAYVETGRFADARAARELIRTASGWTIAQPALETLDAQEQRESGVAGSDQQKPAPPPQAQPQPQSSTQPLSKPPAPVAPADRPGTPQVPAAHSTDSPPAKSQPASRSIPAPAPAIQPAPAKTAATAPVTTATQPIITSRPGDSAQPPAQSPLVAASRYKPSSVTSTSSVLAELRDAEQLLSEGKLLAARQIYLRLENYSDLPRITMLTIARGLNQTSAFRESSIEYQRVQPFQKGEEMHMFYEAVNRYETGDYPTARDLLAQALPSLETTREVTLYRGRIEAAR